MKQILTLAWRNLGRNRRRTIITICAVTFATLLAVAMRGVQLGTYEENIGFALRLFTGFAQLQHPGFLDNPSLSKNFTLDDELERLLAHTPGIIGYAPRLYADGLVSFNHNSLGAALFGVAPALERNVITFTERIQEGRFFTSDSTTEVVIGYKLLENLKAGIGDKVVILAQARDGTLSNKLFTIVGTVKTGSQEFDGMAIFAGLGTLQRFLVMEDRVNVVALAMSDVREIGTITTTLNASIDTSRVVALPWEILMPELQQSIELDNISGVIFLGILIAVVAFGILNTVLMSVTERFREFGVLLALGMPQEKLVMIVFLETILITGIGLVLGNILAAGVNYYLIVNPIELGGDYASMMEEYGFLPVIRSSLRASSFTNTSLSILLISLMATIYPLVKTFKLEPLKGIRYT